MKLKLTSKLTLIFVLFAAILLVIVNFLGYSLGRSSLQQAALSELEVTAEEKQAALEAWLQEGRNDILAITKDPITIEAASGLTLNHPDGVTFTMLHSQLLAEFQ